MNASFQNSPSSGSPCGCGGTTSISAGHGGSCGCGGVSNRSGSHIRPRFFAGQLLTEEDLQALGDYMTQKDRLHNRHFMGAGVVCGLDVTCHPCGRGKIIVHPGYALDCCGNDIVLPCKEELDVNALVRDLRQSLLGGYDCGDPCREKTSSGNGEQDASTKTDDGSRHYSLYVRYCEEEIDPVTPYSIDEPCVQAVCEPSRIREGFRFELRCSGNDGTQDNIFRRLIRCIGELTGTTALTKNLIALVLNQDAAAIANVKEGLLDLLDRSPDIADCALRDYVQSVAIPATGTVDNEVAEKLIHAYMRLFRDCFCEALNPPCHPCEDPGVLLACLEVKDCEVIDICTMSRTFVLTAPAYRYWYGILVDQIGNILERACCTEIPKPEIQKKREVKTPGPIEKMPVRMAETITSDEAREEKVKESVEIKAKLSELDLASLFKGKLKESIRNHLGISPEGFNNLANIIGSIGTLTDQGVFDRIVPGGSLLRTIDWRTELSKTVEEQLRKSEIVQSTVSRIVDDRVDERLEKVGKGLSPAEVDKRVEELVQENRQKILEEHNKEIKRLKSDFETLKTQFAGVKDAPAKPKGKK